MAKRLIDADALKQKATPHYFDNCCYAVSVEDIDDAPTVDAVEYDVLRKWLHVIAINNVNVPVTMDVACEIIVERFDGLRKYARANGERRTDGNL